MSDPAATDPSRQPAGDGRATSTEGLHRRAMKALFALTPWGLQRRIQRVDEELSAQLQTERERIDHSERRLDHAERRLDLVEAALGVAARRLDVVEASLRLVQDELEALRGDRLTAVDERLDRAESGLDASTGEVERLRDVVVPAVSGRADALLERLFAELEETGSLVERLLLREPLPVRPAAPAQDTAIAAELARVQPLLVDALRGGSGEIRHRLGRYLPWLKVAAPVLDLGCGRGELLLLLREAGVAAAGVEGDPALAGAARRRGLEVLEGDVLEVLAAQPDASRGAVTAIHLAEHLEPGRLLTVLDQVRRVLRPGGLLLVESPDPRSLVVGGSLFWLDPTHVRPLLPETLELLLETAGFEVRERLRLHPFGDEQRLPAITAPVPETASDGVSELTSRVDELRRRLDELLFGTRDFAVLAATPAGVSGDVG
jgi:O-antigen chain-terminating methyltransferase